MPYPVILNGDHAEFERDHADMKPEDRPDWPLPSFDARDWARAFCKVAKEHGHELDDGWMTSWFANALMRGFDEATARSLKSSLPADTVSEEMVEQAREIVAENSGCSSFRCFHDDECACRDVSRQILALAHADDGWRPIEDGVPKDGTGILVWIKGAELPFTARWSVARNRWVDMQNDESVYPSPTHWRPLPAPPKDGRE